MDRTQDCGSCNVGSIPTEGTTNEVSMWPQATRLSVLRVGIEKVEYVARSRRRVRHETYTVPVGKDSYELCTQYTLERVACRNPTKQ